MTELRRLDELTAQRVGVAIVFKEMLGIEDAVAYMNENGIPQHIAERVLIGAAIARASDGAIAGCCQNDLGTSQPVAPKLRSIKNPQERPVDGSDRHGIWQPETKEAIEHFNALHQILAEGLLIT